MKYIHLERVSANGSLRCDLCLTVIQPLQIFWNGVDDEGHLINVCRDHVPLNAEGFDCHDDPETGIRVATAHALDVELDLLPKLAANWNEIFSLTADEFEELVFNRLLAMDLQPLRMGKANQADGGIDIMFFSREVLPIVGAVQVKHHREASRKTSVSDIRDFIGALSKYPFNVAMIVTNTGFTEDAIHFAQEPTSHIRLRGEVALRKWINGDFSIESIERVMRTVEFHRGFPIRIPQFL